MKQIIDGKRYDTEKAERVATWNNGCYGNDLHSCSESLYRTKNGNYFVHGYGGAMSSWSQSCDGGNGQCNGEGIEALSPQGALEWLEDKGEDVPEGCPEVSALVVDA